MAQEYSVTYPSGREFKVAGALGTITFGSLLSPTIIGADGQATVLDPRAVIRDMGGLVVFTGCSTAEMEANLAREW